MSAWCHIQWWHHRSRFQIPPIPAHLYGIIDHLHVDRCRIRGESQEICTAHMLLQVWKKLPIQALKLRENITRSPKQGYQWPNKMLMSFNFFLKKYENPYSPPQLMDLTLSENPLLVTLPSEVNRTSTLFVCDAKSTKPGEYSPSLWVSVGYRIQISDNQ